MKKSRFFAELSETYASEIDDLVSDSAGKTVLQSRLKEKRDEIHAILPMIEFAPEMVAVAFYEAFGFKDSAVLLRAVTNEPGHPHFPQWNFVKGSLSIADWAKPLIEATLREEGGDAFLVTTVGLEFLRHIERTHYLIYVIDMSGIDDRDPIEDYRKLRRELKLYNAALLKRPSLIVANKMDMPASAANLKRFRSATRTKPLPAVAELGEGLDAVRAALHDHFFPQPKRSRGA